MSAAPLLELPSWDKGEVRWRQIHRVAPLDGPEDGIHVWQFDLTTLNGAGTRADLLSWLSTDEKARADRFHFAKDKAAYILVRAYLRLLLSLYTHGLPGDISFAYGAYGKPVLQQASHANASDRSRLEFNVSHTEGWAVIAVTRGRRVGIDVEKTVNCPDLLEIAKQHFSTEEYRKLCGLSELDRPSAFYRCWTRKEAVLKGIGSGLVEDVSGVEVSLLKSESPGIVRCGWDPRLSACWQIQRVETMGGYECSMAYEEAVALHENVIQSFNWPQ